MPVKRCSRVLSHLAHLLRDLFNLGRLGMAPLTISLTAAGYYITAASPQLCDVYLLMGMGACAHYFGFGLNDILDRQIDRYSPSRQDSPLVRGTLPLWLAYMVVIIQVPLAFFLYNITQPALFGILILVFSVLASMVYNLWSKTGIVPRLFAELSLAASIGALLLSSSMHNSHPITPTNLAAGIAATLILLDLNSISSGLKDLAADLHAGASSFVISLGASIDEVGIIHLPRRLVAIALTIHISTCAALVVLGVLLHSPMLSWVFAALAFLYSSMHLRLMLKQATFASLQQSAPILGGYYLYFALLALMFPGLPIFFKVFVIALGIFLVSFPIRLMIRVSRKGYIFLNK